MSFELRDISANPVTFTKDIYLSLSNNSPYGRFTDSATGIVSMFTVKIPKNLNSSSFYYRNSVTGLYTLTTFRDGFIPANFNVTVKNKLTIANAIKTVSYGNVTSRYNLQMLVPNSSSGTRSKGTISYTDTQPNDGDIITVDSLVFEFDSNSSITSGRILIGI